MNKQQLIQTLQLEPHVEGGYFRRTYGAKRSLTVDQGEERPIMSSIYYLLTDDSPVGYFHRNLSDIVHYWHCGDPLTYYLIDAGGQYREVELGPDLDRGQRLQLTVPGGVWKATELRRGSFGLLSEAVAPGFDYADMELATEQGLRLSFPELWQQRGEQLQPLCKNRHCDQVSIFSPKSKR